MKKELILSVIIGAISVTFFAGVSASSLLFAALAITCPPMMVLMHGGHRRGAHNREASQQRTTAENLEPTGP